MDLSEYSDEELMQAAGLQSNDLSSYSDDELMAAAGIKPKGDGFLARSGENIMGRANELADNVVAYKYGEKSAPELAVNFIGKAGAGTLKDLGDEALVSGFRSLPDTAQDGLKRVGGAVGDAFKATSVGKVVTNATKQYPEFAQNHPRVASQLESVGNLAAVAPMAKTITATGKGIEKAVPYIQKFEDASQKLPSVLGDVASGAKQAPVALSSDAIKSASNNAYAAAAQQGGLIRAELTNKFLDKVDAATPKSELGRMIGKNDPVLQLSKDIAEKRGKPITLAEAQEFDEYLGDAIDGLLDTGRVTKKAKRLLDIQDEFRGMIDGASELDIVGGKAGFEALKDGRQLWSAQAKMRDLEKIISRAETMDNPATAIRTGFRNLAGNAKRLRGYPPEVQKMIKHAADTGVIGDLLGIAGSRLNPILGGATGGVVGAAATATTSAAARNARTAVQMGRANKVTNAVSETIRPVVDKYAAPIKPTPKAVPAKPLALPAPQTTNFVDKSGRAIPLTEAERQALGQAPSEFINPTIEQLRSLPPAEAKALLERYFNSVRKNKSPR